MKDVTVCDLCESVIGKVEDMQRPSVVVSVGSPREPLAKYRSLDICARCAEIIYDARGLRIRANAPPDDKGCNECGAVTPCHGMAHQHFRNDEASMSQPRRVWDRSGCRERVCYCHDDTAPGSIAARQGSCGSCGCRVVDAETQAAYERLRRVVDAPAEREAICEKCGKAYRVIGPSLRCFDCLPRYSTPYGSREIHRDGKPFVVIARSKASDGDADCYIAPTDVDDFAREVMEALKAAHERRER